MPAVEHASGVGLTLSAAAVHGEAAVGFGEPDAAVLMAHADAVRRFCRSRTASEADADDATQDTFVRFLQRRERRIINPEAWLIHAAACACKDVNRRKQREVQLESVPEPASPTPEDAAVASALMMELLQRLRPQDARLLADLYIGGWTMEAVAQRLNVPSGTVRIRAMRARGRARSALEAIGGAVGSLLWPQTHVESGALSPPRLRAWSSLRDRAGRLSGRLCEVSGLQVWGVAAQGLAGALVVTLVITSSGSSATAPSERAAAAGVGHALVADNHTAAISGVGRERPAPTTASGRNEARPSWQGGAVTPGQVAGNLLAPGAGAHHEDAGISSMTPSPSYPRDRTVFASGTLVHNCYSTCATVFETNDSGGSWHHLPAVGFGGGQILLPPSYPADRTIFAIGQVGLQRSDDSGNTFRLVAPGAQHAAVSPQSVAGDAAILLGTTPLTWYHAARGTLTPGPVLPPTVTGVDDLAFIGDSNHILVSGPQPDPAYPGQLTSTLVGCAASLCGTQESFPGLSSLRLFVSPAVSTDHTVIAVTSSALEISTDGGLRFHAVTTSTGGQIVAAAFDQTNAQSHALLLGTLAMQGSSASSAVLRSSDQARSFAQLPSMGAPSSLRLSGLLVLPDGRYLASLALVDPSGNFGVRCSTDGGSTWAASC
ncbi:MAG: RNA polymerase sigma factor [Candidatus Dormibacteria bacterium]